MFIRISRVIVNEDNSIDEEIEERITLGYKAYYSNKRM
jgi:hypothetical protein